MAGRLFDMHRFKANIYTKSAYIYNIAPVISSNALERARYPINRFVKAIPYI